jgi:Fur family ferric uptake transcriptional regulator
MQQTAFVDVLGRAGYRLTQPRRQVADLIAGRTSSFTAADLLTDARRRGVHVGRATVFRALDTFAELGALERVDLPSGDHAYVTCEPAQAHHHHIVCRACGRATEITGCDLAPWAGRVEASTGYAVDTHRIELFGLCPDCRAPADTRSRQGG